LASRSWLDLHGQGRGGVAAGLAGVLANRIVAGLFEAGPDVHHGIGHKHRGLDHQFPAADDVVPINALGGTGQDLGTIVVGEVRPAGAEVEPIAELDAGRTAGFEVGGPEELAAGRIPGQVAVKRAVPFQAGPDAGTPERVVRLEVVRVGEPEAGAILGPEDVAVGLGRANHAVHVAGNPVNIRRGAVRLGWQSSGGFDVAGGKLLFRRQAERQPVRRAVRLVPWPDQIRRVLNVAPGRVDLVGGLSQAVVRRAVKVIGCLLRVIGGNPIRERRQHRLAIRRRHAFQCGRLCAGHKAFHIRLEFLPFARQVADGVRGGLGFVAGIGAFHAIHDHVEGLVQGGLGFPLGHGRQPGIVFLGDHIGHERVLDIGDQTIQRAGVGGGDLPGGQRRQPVGHLGRAVDFFGERHIRNDVLCNVAARMRMFAFRGGSRSGSGFRVCHDVSPFSLLLYYR